MIRIVEKKDNLRESHKYTEGRLVTPLIKRISARINAMANIGDYKGLTRAEYESLRPILSDYLDGGPGRINQKNVANWFQKNGMKVIPQGNGWVICENVMREASNLPAIAKVAGVAVSPKISNVQRQDTVFATAQAMGLPVKINAMRCVVINVPDMPTAGAVMQKIYQMFGVKSSLTLTWDGQGKVYIDPKTPIDSAPMLAYAKATGLPPPNPKRYLA